MSEPWGEQSVTEQYFPSEVPADPGRAEEQATGSGGDPAVPGTDAPQQDAPQEWTPTREEWAAMTSHLQSATEAADQARRNAEVEAWALRAGPQAVEQWIEEQHWAAADQEQQQAVFEQQLEHAESYANDYITSIAEREGFDSVDFDAVAALASEVLPEVMTELGATAEAAHVALEAAAQAVLEASPEGQAKADTEFLVDRFARDGFGRSTGADVEKVIADAGGRMNEDMAAKFGSEIAAAEALYNAAGGQQASTSQKWSTIHAALREMKNGRGAPKPVSIDWGRRP